MGATLDLLSEVSDEVSACLAAEDRPSAFRVVADWYGRAQTASAEAFARSIAAAPPTTGGAPWDAMLAGLAEQLCLERECECPAWAFMPDRYLDSWWFLTPYRSLHPSAFVEAPVALANRGVFVHRADFENV